EKVGEERNGVWEKERWEKGGRPRRWKRERGGKAVAGADGCGMASSDCARIEGLGRVSHGRERRGRGGRGVGS
ncbi:hypothetical protein U1Q18_005120, partial [Sarracenia purpurea var. burkii]